MKSIKKKIKSWHHQLKTNIQFYIMDYIYAHPLNREIWNIDQNFCKWIIPRLELLKKVNKCHPPDTTLQGWTSILDEMIQGFHIGARESTENDHLIEKVAQKRLKKSLRLFAKWHSYLWY